MTQAARIDEKPQLYGPTCFLSTLWITTHTLLYRVYRWETREAESKGAVQSSDTFAEFFANVSHAKDVYAGEIRGELISAARFDQKTRR